MSTGLHVSDLETPALVIDLDILERNLARLAEYGQDHHLRLRPHTKTHKIPALGRKQVELGAVGLTVAKVSEAEVMLTSGTRDLLVAYPIIGRAKLERLMEVAAKTQVTVSLDSLSTIETFTMFDTVDDGRPKGRCRSRARPECRQRAR